MEATATTWVIMDKTRRVIACGVPRNRKLKFVENALGARILTYETEAKARAGFKVSQFYLGECTEYMTETYGQPYTDQRTGRTYTTVKGKRATEIYEAVQVTLGITIPLTNVE